MENVLSTDELLRQIEALKEENEELKREKTQQRYGLIWEDSPEKLDDPNIVPLLSGDPDEYVRRFVDNEPLNKDILMDEEKPMNYLIEGDNYHSLKALERTHTGKIDVIYIDPPYNTGNEFVYNDKIVDKEDGYRHSKWLSFMSKRLELARRLMSDDGVIFVSIDDNEQAQLKLLMDGIFGENNFISNNIVETSPGGNQSTRYIANQHNYLLIYSKNIDKCNLGSLPLTEEELDKKYSQGRDEKGRYYRERIWKRGVGGRKEDVPSLHFPVYYNPNTGDIRVDKEIKQVTENNKDYVTIIPYHTKGVEGRWTWSRQRMIEYKDYLEVKKTSGEFKLYKKVYEHEDKGRKMKSIITGDLGRTELGSLEIKTIMNGKVFSYPKYSGFIKEIIRMYRDKSAIVLDFFAGSGTTGHAVLELNEEDGGNRQFILCTNNEVSEEKVRNYFHEQRLIPKPNKTEFNKFKKENPDQVLDFMKSDEYQELGIARSVTYERLRRVIEGYTTPKGKEVEGIPANLMYLTTKEYTKDEVSWVRETGRFGKTTEMYAGLMYLKYPRTTHTVMFITDEVGFSNFSGIDTLPTENVVIVLSGLDYPHEIANIIRKEVKTKNLIFEYLKY